MTNSIEVSDEKREKYYVFLDRLRDSGVCNMFGASPYLREEFSELNQDSSNKVLGDWMNSFDERHPED